ncbi:hypothetical protein D1007_38643 [Hordeum vulgare]|nr:hypothetical protein D1007_38643 [Hordeum vulgare]
MKTRDLDFAGRPRLLMVDRFYYGNGGRRPLAPGAPRLRRPHAQRASRRLPRAQEAAALLDRVPRAGGVVNLSDSLVVYSSAVISRYTLGGADCGVGEGGGDGARLRKAFGEMEELLGTVPMGESVPWLGWVDTVTGLERRAKRVFEEMDGLLDADHRQRRRAGAATVHEEDFVDVMLGPTSWTRTASNRSSWTCSPPQRRRPSCCSSGRWRSSSTTRTRCAGSRPRSARPSPPAPSSRRPTSRAYRT